jgi:hypothetical protein
VDAPDEDRGDFAVVVRAMRPGELIVSRFGGGLQLHGRATACVVVSVRPYTNTNGTECTAVYGLWRDENDRWNLRERQCVLSMWRAVTCGSRTLPSRSE